MSAKNLEGTCWDDVNILYLDGQVVTWDFLFVKSHTSSGCTLKVLYIWGGYNIIFKLCPNKLDLEVKFKMTNIDIRSDKPEMMSNHKKTPYF